MSTTRVPAEFRTIPVSADEKPPTKKAYDATRDYIKDNAEIAGRLWSEHIVSELSDSTDSSGDSPS